MRKESSCQKGRQLLSFMPAFSVIGRLEGKGYMNLACYNPLIMVISDLSKLALNNVQNEQGWYQEDEEQDAPNPQYFYGRTVRLFSPAFTQVCGVAETEEELKRCISPTPAAWRTVSGTVGLHFEGGKGGKPVIPRLRQTADGWAYIDSRLPNRILAALRLPATSDYDKAYPETAARQPL